MIARGMEHNSIALAEAHHTCAIPKPGKRVKDADRQADRERGKKRRDAARAAQRHEEEFGPHAELIRELPCAADEPRLYASYEAVLETLQTYAGSGKRLSDPHHAVTRQRRDGKARHLLPLCEGPAGCHRKCSGINSSERQLQLDCGLDFTVVAAWIWAAAHVLFPHLYTEAEA